MASWGYVDYEMTDLNQEMYRCPECGEKKVFVRTWVPFFRINWHPVFPKKQIEHGAICRACNKQVNSVDAGLENYIQTEIAKAKVPKYLFSGAILYPLGILGIILFVALV